jgi:MscS family membrane protein
LPHWLTSINLLDTPLWKWIALLALAVIVVSLFRLTGRFFIVLFGKITLRLGASSRWVWVESVLQPWLVFLSAMMFVLAEQFIDPSALSRLYIGRAILLVVVWSFAWCFINLVDVFLSRIDSLLDPRQRVVSHSLIYLGRRTSKFAILVVALIIVLDNWGYNMTTMIAGLGVGGIAVALAAQSTIANVFGGVSVIGDRPVMVGDFGNFGGVMGTVEDIGMRSTRVRTLNRTLMSIPNASFAGMNLENYASRDKILFNPTLQIKRGTPKDKTRQLMKALEELLKNDKRMEVGPAPVRLSSLSAASFALEIFAYALTSDIDNFYRIEAELILEIDDAILASGIELV